jgi:histidinol-phosphate/aromatic aminotransferase/cobyric acid decarboxylase-like protein
MSRFVAPEPGRHGGDGARLAALLGMAPEEILDLSVSLNPCAPDMSRLIRAHAGASRRYPDPQVATAALAQAVGVDEARLVLTNGGAEAIALVAAEFPVGDVDPCEFSLYARHLERIEQGAPRWRSNPHNPTGRLARPDERAAVWDEAFYSLATGMWSREDTDAVVVGSLTKVFACPGMRAGYVIAPKPELAQRLRDRQPEWSVNGLVCSVVPELLEIADLRGWASAIAGLRGRLEALLREHEMDAAPSDANFVLVRGVPGLRDALAEHGVLVRDTASFGIAEGVRIAVPEEAGLDRLTRILEKRSR